MDEWNRSQPDSLFCLSMSWAAPAAWLLSPSVDAGHLPEILSLGVAGDPAAARQHRIRQIIAVNLPLGLLVVVIGGSGRYGG